VALADTIVLTKESLQVLETRLSKEKKVTTKVAAKEAVVPAAKKAPVKKAAAKSAEKPAAKKSKGAK